MWDSIIKPTLILVVICTVVTGALAYVNDITKDIILERTALEEEQHRQEVMNVADRFVKIEPEGLSGKISGVYEAYRQDSPVGYVVDVTTKGYGGTMKLTVGIDINGQVTGVVIGDNDETAGLGARAKEPGFTDQFRGVSVNDTLTVVTQGKKADNEIEAISGATVTSRAVTEGVQAALDTVKLLKDGGN